MSTVEDLVARTRSIRRFIETDVVSRETLERFVELARLSASGGNLQPLKYKLSCDADSNARIFPWLRWAGYLGEAGGPGDGERPSAYIILLRDNSISASFSIDHGIAVQSMRLAATEAGLASCIVGTVDRARLRSEFELSSDLEILIVLALGKAREDSVVEEMKGDDVRYWRDEKGAMHVPKRSIEEIIVS